MSSYSFLQAPSNTVKSTLHSAANLPAYGAVNYKAEIGTFFFFFFVNKTFPSVFIQMSCKDLEKTFQFFFFF